MEKPQITLLGNKAEIVERALRDYNGVDLKKLDSTRDANTTTSFYEFRGIGIKTIYNKCNEVSVGEDIPDQARNNIGIYLTGKDESIKDTISLLEKITNVPFIEGETTKLMKEKGMK